MATAKKKQESDDALNDASDDDEDAPLSHSNDYSAGVMEDSNFSSHNLEYSPTNGVYPSGGSSPASSVTAVTSHSLSAVFPSYTQSGLTH